MKEFEPARGYTRADWDDAETPEATPEELAAGRPFAVALPELAATMRRKPGPAKVKQAVSIRLDTDVLAKLCETGPGWQSRVNDHLREWLEPRRSR